MTIKRRKSARTGIGRREKVLTATSTVRELAAMSLLDKLNGQLLAVYLRLVAAGISEHPVIVPNTKLHKVRRTAVRAVRALVERRLIKVTHSEDGDSGAWMRLISAARR